MLRGQSCRPFSVAGTEGHQQFVILPIPYSLGRSEPRAHGKKLFMNTEPKPGGGRQPGEVGSQPVGKIHHGGGYAGGGQDASFPDTRHEGKMVAGGEAAAERSRYGNQIPRPRRAAQYGFACLHFSGQRHVDDEPVRGQAGAFPPAMLMPNCRASRPMPR